jgi:hypothetical protein
MRAMSLAISTTVGVAALAIGGPAFATDGGKLSIDPAVPSPGQTVQVNGSCPGNDALRSITSAAFSGGVAKVTPTDSPQTFSGTAEISPEIKPGTYTVRAKCKSGGQVTHKFKVAAKTAEYPEEAADANAPGALRVSPRSARPGQTVKITGNCPGEDMIKSITSKAFAGGSAEITLKGSPLEFAGTARIAKSAGSGSYTVRATCDAGKTPVAKIRVVGAKGSEGSGGDAAQTPRDDATNEAGQVKQVPRGGAKTGEVPSTGAGDDRVMLGAGLLGGAALLGGLALALRRRSGSHA